MSYLLDVNVLIALIDPLHVHHERAHRWFGDEGGADWMSCPTTQNGVIRIVGNARYPNTQAPRMVLESLESLLAAGRHRFVADAVSLLDPLVDRARMLSAAQVTDTYLLCLAASAGARLATFDRRVVTSAVPEGSRIAYQIE